MIFGEKLKEKDGEENQILCFVWKRKNIFSFLVFAYFLKYFLYNFLFYKFFIDFIFL